MDFYSGGYSMYNFLEDPSFITGLGFAFAVIMIFVACSGVLGLVFYILRSIGLYRLADNRGMSGSGLAWIPWIGSYRIGSVADDIAAREGSQSYFRHFLLAGKILSIVLYLINLIVTFSYLLDDAPLYGYGDMFFTMLMSAGAFSSLYYLISFASYVITIVALNKIYKCYRPDISTIWTVLSVLPFMQSIFPFVIRGDAPAPMQVSPWGHPQQGIPPQGGYYPPPNGQWQAPPPNGGYPPPPYQEQQPLEPGGYYPPRAPEPPPYYPPQQGYEFDQFPPVENEDPPTDS